MTFDLISSLGTVYNSISNIVLWLCAVGGIGISLYNTYSSRLDSKERLKITLEEWIDTNDYRNVKSIRCIIRNVGKVPVHYEKLLLRIHGSNKIIFEHEFKEVSPESERSSFKKYLPDIIEPREIRMASVELQTLIHEFEYNKETNVESMIILETTMSSIFKSNKLKLDLSTADENNL